MISGSTSLFDTGGHFGADIINKIAKNQGGLDTHNYSSISVIMPDSNKVLKSSAEGPHDILRNLF